MKNILLTTLGATDLRETIYEFNGQTFHTKFCGLGLTRLLPVNFDFVFVLLTPEAKEKHSQSLEAEGAALGVKIRVLDIVSGQSIEEIWQIFDVMTESLNSDDCPDVYLDITNSYRHLPLLSFTSLSYLESSRKARLAGIYYGAFDPKRADHTPVFDLTPLASIVRGSYAVRAFEETGAVNQLGDFLQELVDFSKNDQRNLVRKLQSLHGSINSGLPLEAGDASRELNALIERSLPGQNNSKAGNELLKRLQEKITRIALAGGLDKTTQVLNLDELARQLDLIDWHIENQNPSIASLLLREWVVNRVWLEEKPEGFWLQERKRIRHLEERLGYWGAIYRNSKELRDAIKTEKYSDLIKIWSGLTGIRNQFAHAGFQEKVVDVSKAYRNLTELVSLCREHFAESELWLLPRRKNDGRKVLVSGMGASFGLLYSAIYHVKPDSVIVVTSDQYREKACEACEKAGFVMGDSLHMLIMKDVFAGFSETPLLIKQFWPVLQNAESVIVNLTGGTTAMQWVMQSAYEQARNNHLPTERVAFIDRRSSVEQQQNPWKLGEIVEIEKLMMKSEKKSE